MCTRALLHRSTTELRRFTNMKVLVVIAAVLACTSAKPDVALTTLGGFGYASTSIHPYTYAAYPYVMSPHLAYAAPLGAATAYHTQDIIGQATYGYAEPFQAHHEVQDVAGNKVGSYSYVTPEGKVVKTDYIADATGYHVASNALPVAPVDTPVPVVDTPEVAAAKAAHLALVEETKTRTRRDVTPASTVKVDLPTIPFPHHIYNPIPYPFVHHVVY